MNRMNVYAVGHKKSSNCLFLLFVFILCASFLNAQVPSYPKIEDLPFIEVIGTSEKEIIPDEIYIGIVIRERVVNKVKVSIEEQESKLKSALNTLKINLSDLELSDANADYVKIRWQKSEVLTKKEYQLKVSNATTVGQVFLELEKLEITDAYISRVNHSKMDSLRKETKIKAIQAAKEKADYLLNAIGEKTGKPLLIKENDFNPSLMANQINVRGSRMSEVQIFKDGSKWESDQDKEIQFQKIKINASVYVKFLIK